MTLNFKRGSPLGSVCAITIKTKIVVSHRLQTVMKADQIIVLHRKNGGDAPTQVVEQGTHQELLKKWGIYASMFALQSWQNIKKN